jgi:hypothetical protein
VTRWTPPGGERLDELSHSLAPLAPVKQHVSVLSNMELRNAYPGTHATSNSAFLSASRAKLTESADYYLGTTADQLAAKQIGRGTQLPSPASATTATPASTTTVSRGRRRRRRCRAKRIHESCSSDSSATARPRRNAAPP